VQVGGILGCARPTSGPLECDSRLAKSYSLPFMPFGTLKEWAHIPLLLDPVVRASRDRVKGVKAILSYAPIKVPCMFYETGYFLILNLKIMPCSTTTPLASVKDRYILQIISIKGAQVHLLTYTRKQTCTINYEKVNARDPCRALVLVLNVMAGHDQG